ncbi:MAG: M28 family peptidase [Polyangiaceae bacterium]
MARLAAVGSFAFCAFFLGCGATDTKPLAPPAPAPIVSAVPPAPSASQAALPPLPVMTPIEAAALESKRGGEIARSIAQEVGPRLEGSEGDKLAIAWALETMKALGLQNVHAEEVTVPVWRRGAESAELMTPAKQPLAITALGWSGATPKEGVTAGVLEVSSLDELKALPKGAAKGKIVFGNVVMEKTNDGSGYGRAVPMRFAGPKLAQDAGALAFVMRTVGTAEDRAPHAGADGQREANKPLAAGALSTTDAELLHDVLKAHPDAKLHVLLTPSRGPDAKSANVIGDIVGKTRPEEIVLMGAHLDSWDLGRGAIDDGAGDAIVLEAARLAAENANKSGKLLSRTVRVVLFAAEESSGAGGKAYFAAHPDSAKHVLALEADTGTDRVLSTRYGGDPAKKAAYNEMVKALAPLGIEPIDGAAHPGSDVTPLVKAGIPTIELRQDMSRYFDVHHSANDVEAEIHPAGIEQAASAFAEVVTYAATMKGDFGRGPPPPPWGQ